ncbi:Uncharacterized protein DBV15_08150 [Temnothorax longispinosus]|uniref:Uncharacterized protein n=1 Tax=Temnothorax longispinosus TaxID=300112 RepID=A0A4V3SCH8_9HYME|nr:Uncharacterized protein DBV15_08150 [Temnothorax longispinosus]
MLTDMTPAAAGQLYPQLQSIAKSPVHGHVVSKARCRRLAATVESLTPPDKIAEISSKVYFGRRRCHHLRRQGKCVPLSDVPLTFSRATMDCERPLRSAMHVVRKTLRPPSRRERGRGVAEGGAGLFT